MDTRLRLLVPALFGVVAIVLIALTPCAARASSDDDELPDVPEPVEVCLSCHAIGPDEPVLEGPTLWGVVGRPVASVADFEYSAALKAKGGVWTRERLERWIAGPAAVTPGTKMKLAGVRSAADREVVLDFLETLAPGGKSSPSAD